MAFERELDQAVAEVRVGAPARLEQLAEDAGRGEPRNRVDLVDEDLAVGADEEVAAREPGAADRAEDAGGELANALDRLVADRRGDLELHSPLRVFRLEVVPLRRLRHDRTGERGLDRLRVFTEARVADHRALDLAP